MKTFRQFLTRGLFTLAAAGVALAITPGTARADNIDFTVDESAVPLAGTTTYTVDDLQGKYQESLVLNGDGTFTAYLVVNFSTYVNNGLPVDTNLDATVVGGETTNTNLYSAYALVSVTGSFTQSAGPSGTVLTFFDPNTAAASIWLDPTRNTVTDYTSASVTSGGTEDLLIMTAGTLDQILSTGFVQTLGTTVLTGSYALVFTDPAIIAPDGTAYWPTLSLLNLIATASGDIDTTGQGTVFPTGIKGDTDITFQQTAVPEPASLVLLGTGLIAAGYRSRRRRAQKQ